jgi:hypothetical protein
MSIEMQFAKHDYAARFAASPAVGTETIEAWMSAGVLTPDETAGATRILNLLRQNRMGASSSKLKFSPAHAHYPDAYRRRRVWHPVVLLKRMITGCRRVLGRLRK